MSTKNNINIIQIINNNSKLKNENLSINKFNIKFLNFTKSEKFRIDNIISTILLKEKINDNDMTLLRNIFSNLNTEDLDVLKSSSLMHMIDKVYLIKRQQENDFNKMFEELNNYDLKNYYEIIKNGKGSKRDLPKQYDLFENIKTKNIHEVFAFYKIENNRYIVTFFQDNTKKSFFALDTLNNLYNKYKSFKKSNTRTEKFNLFKAISKGENSKIIRDGEYLKLNYGNKPILYKNYECDKELKYTPPKNNSNKNIKK